MRIDCTYLFNQWRNRSHEFSGGIERCNIVIRVFFASGTGPHKGDLLSVNLVNGANSADRVMLPPAHFPSSGGDVVFMNVPLARHGFAQVSVFSGVRSPATMGPGGGGSGTFLGTGRMNSMFVRDTPGPTRAPRMQGQRTLIFNLREESFIQSPYSTAYTGNSSSTSVTTGAQPWGVGTQVTGQTTTSDPTTTNQGAPQVYGTGRWTLEQVR